MKPKLPSCPPRPPSSTLPDPPSTTLVSGPSPTWGHRRQRPPPARPSQIRIETCVGFSPSTHPRPRRRSCGPPGARYHLSVPHLPPHHTSRMGTGGGGQTDVPELWVEPPGGVECAGGIEGPRVEGILDRGIEPDSGHTGDGTRVDDGTGDVPSAVGRAGRRAEGSESRALGSPQGPGVETREV